MSYSPFSVFLKDLPVNLKSNFGKTKKGRSLIFVILDNQAKTCSNYDSWQFKKLIIRLYSNAKDIKAKNNSRRINQP